MTREEAIQVLKKTIAYESDFSEAKRMAIEALEREIEYGQMVVDFTKGETMKPDEWKYDKRTETHGVCSDLISRQAAIDRINWFIEACKEEHTGGVVFTIDDAKYAFIKAVESVEPVHGEWEHWGSPFSDESEIIDTIVCSVCGARFIEPKDESKGEYNFCPNCGADMRGK